MYDTSSSSCSESEDEGGEESSSQLSRKLQETPSLAKVKHILSIEEAGQAAKISNMPIHVGGFFAGGVLGESRWGAYVNWKQGEEVGKGKVGSIVEKEEFTSIGRKTSVGQFLAGGGVPGKSRTRKSLGASVQRNQGKEKKYDKAGGKSFVESDKYARIGHKDGERDVTKKQIAEARHLGGRQIFKRAIMISSSSSEDEEEEEVQRGVHMFKRWNIISSDEEEDIVTDSREAGMPRLDDENNSVETNLQSHKTGKNVGGHQEAQARREVCLLRENTPPSSSLGPSPSKSPVQEAISSLEKVMKQEQRRKEKEVKKSKDEMVLRLLDERMKRCIEEGEKEFLCMAAHLINCKGCQDTRYIL